LAAAQASEKKHQAPDLQLVLPRVLALLKRKKRVDDPALLPQLVRRAEAEEATGEQWYRRKSVRGQGDCAPLLLLLLLLHLHFLHSYSFQHWMLRQTTHGFSSLVCSAAGIPPEYSKRKREEQQN
jgi:hypothetical protein